MKNLSASANHERKSGSKIIKRAVGVLLFAAAIFLAREVFIEAIVVVAVTLPSSPDQHEVGLQFAPHDPSVQSWIGAYYMLHPTGRDPQQAIDHYKEAVRYDPMYYLYWGELGSAYEMSGDLDLAEKAYRNMVTLAPNNDRSHWSLANCLLRKGDLDGASAEFKRYLEIYPLACDYVYEILIRANGVSLDRIESSVVPAAGSSRARFAIFCIVHNNTQLAIKTWSSLSAADKKEQTVYGQQLIAGLLYQKLYAEARSLWNPSAPDANETSKLLLNGSFEHPFDAYSGSFGWHSKELLSGSLTLTSSDGHNGGAAVRADLTGQNSKSEAKLMQLVAPITAGHYSLTYFVKASGFAPPVQPVIQILGEDGKPIATDQPSAGTYEWAQRHVDLVVQPDNRAIIVVIRTPAISSFDQIGKGQVLMDDFSIDKQN